MKADLEGVPTLSLVHEVKRRFNCLSQPRKRVLLLGATGTGKSTLAQQLESQMCLCSLDYSALQAGVFEEMTQKRCRRGFVLHSVPDSEVETIDTRLAQEDRKIDQVVHLKLDAETAEARLAARQIDPPSGRVYSSLYAPQPETPNTDDYSGRMLESKPAEYQGIQEFSTYFGSRLATVDVFAPLNDVRDTVSKLLATED